jgi:hypothetical protein
VRGKELNTMLFSLLSRHPCESRGPAFNITIR